MYFGSAPATGAGVFVDPAADSRQAMTRLLQDILRQPQALRRVIDHLRGPGRASLEAAAAALRGAGHVYVTGIGASWCAALYAGMLLHRGGRPVYMLDAAELLHVDIPDRSVILALSRSGRSIEIVKLLAKARQSKAEVIGLTCFEDGQLAREAGISLLLPVDADHAISVNTYTSLLAGGAAVCAAATGRFDASAAEALTTAFEATAASIPAWQRQLEKSPWLAPGATYCFLARGTSLGSAYAAQLLWQEGAKSPATAMGSGSFRHGPQEMVTRETRFILWIDGETMRDQDLAMARDLRGWGAAVMLVGSRLPGDAGDLVFELPHMPPGWPPVIDIVPAQLAAEALARHCGADCDTFRHASYIVESDGGLARN
jgi:fructoselysine-6-P-deglycase FrlB-like protein